MTGRKVSEGRVDRLVLMNSGTGRKCEVVIVLSNKFAPNMPDLARGRQIWALRTADTEKVAQQFWKDHPPLDAETGSGGITLFTGEGDPEKDFLSILDDVELHHGIASSERPALSVLRVLGAHASETIRDALRAHGFIDIEPSRDGFRARWQRE
jgi:hypothetical protein